jgi:NADH-quinone oxidoreductase subunit C
MPNTPDSTKSKQSIPEGTTSTERSDLSKSKVIPPPRRGPKVELAPTALDAKGEALSNLIAEMFSDDEINIGTEVDEVTIRIGANHVPYICDRMKKDSSLQFNYFRSLSIVDYIDHLEVNYHLFSYLKRHKLTVKTNLPNQEPRIPTVTGIWRAANWFEREGHDLFGVQFDGHPDLAPLLLYEGFEGYPGLKSYPFHDYDEW